LDPAWHRPRVFFGPLEIKIISLYINSCAKIERGGATRSQQSAAARVGIMNKRTGESVISTDMVKKARRSTSAVEEKRRNKDGTACAFVGKRVCKRRCSATDEQMRSGSKISGREFYTPNFLSSFFLTQNINCESRTLFERRVAVGTKAASLGGCVAL
jgi:hypothetical protein